MIVNADFLRGKITLLNNRLLNITETVYVRTSLEIKFVAKLQTDSS